MRPRAAPSWHVPRGHLQTAVANAEKFMPWYVALMKDERAKLEQMARSMRFDDDTIRSLLSGIDRRHARFIAFNAKTLAARRDTYRAYATTSDC